MCVNTVYDMNIIYEYINEYMMQNLINIWLYRYIVPYDYEYYLRIYKRIHDAEF